MMQSILSKEPIRLTDGLFLQRKRIHEVTGSASDSFAVTIAAKTTGPIVWIGRDRDVNTLTPTAIKSFVDPTRIVLTEGMNRKEVLWAAEQALRSKGAALTILQLSLGPDLKESRRLQLAAEQGRGVGLILIDKCAQNSAAQTRWACSPVFSTDHIANDQHFSRQWLWEITKNKSGPVGRYIVKWKGGINETYNVDMVSTTAA